MIIKQKLRSYTVIGGAGTKLHVEETGNPKGKPLLFIHGYNQCRLVWEKQINSSLREEFRIVILDNRGHGLSEKPIRAYGDSRLWADDIHAVIQTLKLDKPLLIGWSYGGLNIFDYLRYYGEEDISGINLVGARSRIGTPEAIKETSDEYLALKSKLGANDAIESVDAIESFIKLCTYEELTPRDLYFFLGFNVRVPPYVRQGLQERSLSNSDLMHSLKTPFLITHGIEDQIVLIRHGKYNSEIIKNVRASFYEKVGHTPFWEDDKRFNRELRDFANTL